MAIYRYSKDTVSASLSEFKTFIDNYKAGTVFAGATVSVEDTENTSILTIESPTAGTIILKTYISYSSGIYTYFTIQDDDASKDYMWNPGQPNCYLIPKSVFLCKYGCMFQLQWTNMNDNYAALGTPIAVTVDKNGKFVVMAFSKDLGQYHGTSGSDTRMSDPPTSFNVETAKSLTSIINAQPRSNVYYTALSQMQTVSIGNVFTEIPKAFFAYETQAISQYRDLFTNTMGTVKFISNGVWYIVDEEAE